VAKLQWKQADVTRADFTPNSYLQSCQCEQRESLEDGILSYLQRGTKADVKLDILKFWKPLTMSEDRKCFHLAVESKNSQHVADPIGQRKLLKYRHFMVEDNVELISRDLRQIVTLTPTSGVSKGTLCASDGTSGYIKGQLEADRYYCRHATSARKGNLRFNVNIFNIDLQHEH
jgi:hypothetical protein